MTEEAERPKGKQGFASMDPDKRRAISALGGKSVPPEKRSFSLNARLAAAAGRKGGLALERSNRSFARDRELAIAAEAKGGTAQERRKRADNDD